MLDAIGNAARRHTNAVAVVHDGEATRYAELRRRTRRLAHELHERGVGAEAIVGIALPRSLDAVVALLGTLEAGAAYLPLDLAHPDQRLAFLLADSAASVVVTSSRFAARLRALGATVVAIDAPLEPHADAWEPPAVTPATAAYVLYTSGTSGRPKGVVVEQGAVAHFVSAAAEAYGIASDDVVLNFAGLTFDASVEELLVPLACGARVVLRSDAAIGSVGTLMEFCAQHRVTVLPLPTAYWHDVAEALAHDGVQLAPSIRLVVIGGEAARADRLALWQRHVGADVRLLNTYGPTEATVVTTCADLTASVPTAPLPIGTPLSGVRVYLLDQAGAAVADGAIGELTIAGPSVARGYLGRPDLTDAAFVPDPFAAGERMYRTGDRARMRPDGQLEFVGRHDRQVKIGGIRIELDEVEAALRCLPAVQEAAAIAVGDPGHLRVLGVVTCAASVSELELRAALANTLPAAFIPNRIVRLERMPLNHAGKIDYAALLAQAGEAAPLPAAPRTGTTTQERVAELWREVLGRTAIRFDDRFVDLGGTSLDALRLLHRLRLAFAVELPLYTLFGTETVASLARRIEGAPRSEDARAPISRIAREGPLPISYAQQAVWLVSQMAPETVPYNNQVTIRFTGSLDVAALERSLTAIVARHEIFRTAFEIGQNGTLQQTVHPPWTVVLPVTDLRDFSEPERSAAFERLAEAESRRSFDLAVYPLVRWTLVRLADDETVLVQVEQHFGHDGRSLAIVLSELAAGYRAEMLGLPLPGAPPGVDAADVAVWQRDRLRGDHLERELAFWRDAVAGCPLTLSLPADRPRPKAATFRGATIPVVLSAELSTALRRFAIDNGTTLYVTMMAAFTALLHRCSGQSDLLVGSAVANRARPELDNVVGMLANTLLVRSDASGDPSCTESVARMRAYLLSALEHEETPFELLVEEIHHNRDNGRNPLFQTMFSFHDAEMPSLELPGVTGRLD
ncbi:MAG: amino acid adenylation domain-containing protein, partial [Vulcanimicrobiaceae bacterium]